MKTFFLGTSLFLASIICSSCWADATPQIDNTPQAFARIRFFGQNGVGLSFYPNSDCIGGPNREMVSGSVKSAFLSMLGMVDNESIGMPPSANTQNLAAKNGILSKAFYKEYAVTPSEPLAVSMTFQDVGAANKGVYISGAFCYPFAYSFVPLPGKDYEGYLDIANGACAFNIVEIDVNSGTQPVFGRLAEQCQ